MTGKFLHEALYRGPDQLARLSEPRITICGVGALGSHIADNLARQGVRKIRAIDCDRIEEHNVGTQLYGVEDVGARKVDVLRNRLFRSVEMEIEAIAKEVTSRSVRKLLKGSELVIETFDNSDSRALIQQHCRDEKIQCLHVGLHADYCEVIWDDGYRVPQDVAGDVCEYPLARNLILLAVAIASETVVRFLLDGLQESRSATLRDLVITGLET